LTRTDAKIDFNWNNVSPAAGMDVSNYSIRWTGRLLAPATGNYLFSAKVDDGIRLWIGGQSVINAWGLHDSEDFKGQIYLEAGRYYDLKVEYFNGIFEGEIRLLWTLPGEGSILDRFWSSAKPIEAKHFYQAPPPTPTHTLPPAAPVNKKNTPSKPSVKAKSKPKPAPTVSNEPTAPPPLSATEFKTHSEALAQKTIYFVKTKDEIVAESRKHLDDWVKILARQPQATIEIRGHTEETGDPVQNQRLSELRADLVARYLIQQGLEKNRIFTKGYGGTRPVFQNAQTEAQKALNRRVEIKVR
jgi:outer membrane protein OmpA-like peptidoglycan-associated protein